MNFDKLFEDNCNYKIQYKDIDELKSYLIKKSGWIYIAKTEDNNFLKIGRTSKNPMERAKTLSSAGVFNDYNIIFSLKVFNQIIAEKMIHQDLKKFRVTNNKEFFSVKTEIAITAFNKAYELQVKMLDRFINLDLIKDDIDLIEHAIK